MKKIIIIAITLIALVSCNAANKVKISGVIKGLDVKDSILTIRGHNVNQSISISSEGNFKDEFEIVEAGKYDLFVNKRVKFPLFLNNGYDLNITADAKSLMNTLTFDGKGNDTNNFITESSNEYGIFMQNYKRFLKLDQTKFDAELGKLKTKMNELLSNEKIDTAISKKVSRSLDAAYVQFATQYRKVNAPKTEVVKGGQAPRFYNFENYKGGTTSMDDLKGKYIYIDVWATWCRPCVGQIPALIQLEKEYRNKNIAFVSISSDRINAHAKWKAMIAEKGMEGVQLFMGKDRTFMNEFGIKSIPRFIFIGPNGEIINANAPRPSQKAAVKQMFAAVGL